MTTAFIVGVILLVIAYDLWAHFSGRATTISAVVRGWGVRWSVVPLLAAFGAGLLLGHWFL